MLEVPLPAVGEATLCDSKKRAPLSSGLSLASYFYMHSASAFKPSIAGLKKKKKKIVSSSLHRFKNLENMRIKTRIWLAGFISKLAEPL